MEENKKSESKGIVSVGIDVSKAKLDIALFRSDRSHVAAGFANNSDGITQLIVLLKQQRTAVTVPCVMESTGDYHLLSALMITKEGFRVNCINPLITKKYQRASIRGTKTDTIDAARLAEIGLLEDNLPLFSAENQPLVNKKVISYLSLLEKTKQQLKAGFKQLERVSQDILGVQLDLSTSQQALKELDKQMKVLKHYLVEHGPKEVKELSTIRGVSENQAAVLLSGLGDKTFSHKDQLVAFVGLDIRQRQSGQWIGKQKLSKRGSGYLRKVLFQVAWGLKQNNDTYKEYYDRLRKEGKHYTTVLLAVARKFLRFLFAFYWKKSVILQPTA
jgi:transposase